ncbi:unnamed protein product [Cladocopium goreaui]|uniref:Uncharacterized protein n=1 Tax=Cladocopium goreaui TaxID=2562237 RepID=A0A9P1BFI3_9DINO|nr:unnamed protein product [Cladocopium goreaui]
MYWTEIQFVLSGPINGLFERMFETEAGPLFLNGVFLLTLMRMGVYYGFMQPSYLWHFQELCRSRLNFLPDPSCIIFEYL